MKKLNKYTLKKGEERVYTDDELNESTVKNHEHDLFKLIQSMSEIKTQLSAIGNVLEYAELNDIKLRSKCGNFQAFTDQYWQGKFWKIKDV